MKCLSMNKPVPLSSHISSLNPFLDGHGLLRVRGRLICADLPMAKCKPLIIPGNSHIAALLVRHHHERIQHQGRHFTHEAVCAADLWITGGKRLINTILHACVKCRKLRGRRMVQQMADLPVERLSSDSPFTYVGVDVFGPRLVVARYTRGGLANSKRWAIIFTCMAV